MSATERKSLLNDERVLGWGSVILVLAFWEVTARLTGVNSLYLPRPSQIAVALVALFQTGGLAYDLFMTLYRIFAGFGIALIIALGLLAIILLMAVGFAVSARTESRCGSSYDVLISSKALADEQPRRHVSSDSIDDCVSSESTCARSVPAPPLRMSLAATVERAKKVSLPASP